MFEEALRRDIQVETHAIGDRANRMILDLYEQAFNAVRLSKEKSANPAGVSSMLRLSILPTCRGSPDSA